MWASDQMLDLPASLSKMPPDAEKGGRASGKESELARPRFQQGFVERRRGKGKGWFVRWREDRLAPDGSVRRVHRCETLRNVTMNQARKILQLRVAIANQGGKRPQLTTKLSDFVAVEWLPNAELTLKRSSIRYYTIQLDRHILPALGPTPLCDLSRARIESLLAQVKRRGHASATVRGVRATLSTVLQAAVDREYLERNPAHGIRVREMEVKKDRRFYLPPQIRALLGELSEPCRTIVLVAVLSGMRIGEILALRWKRVDLKRSVIEVAESLSDGEFGTPKTRSSRRSIPISSTLRQILEAHRERSVRNQPEDLLFTTPKGTPTSAKNLYNRVLAPACDRIKEARVSWHSFRHSHATLLSDSGEALKTAQALLGHSDLETTLGVYVHAVPDSQRRAVEKVGDLFKDVGENVLFSNVLKTVQAAKSTEATN